VTDTKIDADLGPLGRIDVEFEPSGAQGKVAPVCQPDELVTYDEGSFVGVIEFHGEEGYADVSATRARLSLQSLADSICAGYSSSELIGPHLPGARLTATVRRPQGRVYLQANQNHPGARLRVRVSVRERRGPIHVVREVIRHYRSGFAYEEGLGSATLSPPTPFSGSALYRHSARPANRWTGNLAVDLPGRSNVSLTGARFAASLLPARFTEKSFKSR
jgi:hypothetical protein